MKTFSELQKEQHRMERNEIISMSIALAMGLFCGFVLGWHLAEQRTEGPAANDDAAAVEAWREGYVQGLEQSGLYRATWKGVERTGVVR